MRHRFFEIKNIIIFTVILLVSAVALTIAIQINSRRTFLNTHEENAKNLLNAVYLNVENEYSSITFHKNATLELRKREVKDISTLALRTVEDYYKKFQTGKLSQLEAQKQAKHALTNFRYDNGVGYVWINNTIRAAPKLIIHPTMPELVGEVLLDEKYNCALGINKNLFHAFIDECNQNGEGYVDYLWPKPSENGLTQDQPKISYVMLFKPWNWIIGTGVYIDDIEKDVQKKITSVQTKLQTTFRKIKLARNGYMFIIDKNYNVVTHPHINSGENLRTIVHPVTEEPLFPEIGISEEDNSKAIEYLWNKPLEDIGNYTYGKIMYVRYFPPLEWYIAASFYDEDIKESANRLTLQLILLSVLLCGIFLLGSIILTRIIRKQHSTEEEVHRIDQLLNDVLAAASEVSIIATDSEGVITLFNSGAQRMLGYSSDEVVGKSTPLLFHKKSELLKRGSKLSTKYGRKVSDFRVLVEKTDSTGFEKRNWTYITKNGSEVLVSLVVTAIKNPDGTSKGYLGIAQDITAQKRAERELRESRKMDAIGQLAGGVAHDFNNMLAAILSAAELIDYETKDNKEINELAGLIVDSAKRSSELTSQLLAFSRKNTTINKVFGVHDAILKTVTLLKSCINKKIAITVNLQARLHNVNGDFTQLQSALLNLGINASHAMPGGGLITFESSNVQLDTQYCNASTFSLNPGEYLSVVVKDTGSGIAPEHIDKIFEPFFTTKKQGKGTGLGLAAAYGTIQQHNGAIYVKSSPGNTGTSFEILLPVTDKNTNDDTISVQSVSGSGTILLVDDEEVIRITTAKMLENLGYSVVVAENGIEALEIYLKKRHDLHCIILDMLMPKMDGRECFYKMKEIDSEVKVIISSGFSKNNDIQKLLDAGLAGFIKKPFKYTELSNVVAQVIGKLTMCN